MAVHLYGHPCDMRSLVNICQEYQLLLIEDCAEALGSYWGQQHVGTFGDIATFSFFGNKTITTGEGGMVITNHSGIYKMASSLKNQAVSTVPYWHEMLGYNYRMTNICAAIGLAQLEQINLILARKREIAGWYEDELTGLPLSMHKEIGNVRHSFWMCSILLEDSKHRDPLRNYLEKKQIETRPLFVPAHHLPMYACEEKYPVAEWLSSRGMNLPSWPGLTHQQIKRIAYHIRGYFSDANN